MKASRRNIANANSKWEKRAAGKAKLSKYEAKIRAEHVRETVKATVSANTKDNADG
jgi:hypothetical protein